MTSGKSEVGAGLATRLGWRHVDLDREIEITAGTSIPEIFARQGEPEFRRLEAEITPRFIELDEIVLSPGGGWITNPALLESLPPDTLTVWLRVSPDEVIRRLHGSPGQPVRPLLREPGKARIEELLAQREPMYARAMLHVDTDGRTVAAIVNQLAEWIAGAPDPTTRQP